MVSVVIRKTTSAMQNNPSMQSVSEKPQLIPVESTNFGERLVEIERDHRGEEHVKEHQRRAQRPSLIRA